MRVELELELDGFEVERAALCSRFGEHPVQRINGVEMRQERFGGLVRDRCRLRYPFPDLGVCKPCARMHYRRVEAVAANFTAAGYRHVADHAQPIDLGLQRAELVGELLGQHRNHTPREVDRCAAIARVGVEGVGVAHVVAHVGDGDEEAKILAHALAVDCIVEVARRLAVDRHQGKLGEVGAILAVALLHVVGKPRRLALRRCRKLVWQIVLAQRYLDFHSWIGVVAEDLHHTRHRLAVCRWLLEKLGDHDLAGLRLAAHIRRNEDVLADALVLGDQVPDATLLVDAADDLAIRALDDVDDGAFGTSALVDADQAHHRAVAVQCLVHFLGPEKHVRSAGVGDQETESVGVPLNLARDQIELGDDAELPLAVGHQLTFARHRCQTTFKSIALGGPVHAERNRELVRAHRHAALAQHIEYLLAARNIHVGLLASRSACNCRRRAD